MGHVLKMFFFTKVDNRVFIHDLIAQRRAQLLIKSQSVPRQTLVCSRRMSNRDINDQIENRVQYNLDGQPTVVERT